MGNPSAWFLMALMVFITLMSVCYESKPQEPEGSTEEAVANMIHNEKKRNELEVISAELTKKWGLHDGGDVLEGYTDAEVKESLARLYVVSMAEGYAAVMKGSQVDAQRGYTTKFNDEAMKAEAMLRSLAYDCLVEDSYTPECKHLRWREANKEMEYAAFMKGVDSYKLLELK